jgi:hypothetical protein
VGAVLPWPTVMVIGVLVVEAPRASVTLRVTWWVFAVV